MNFNREIYLTEEIIILDGLTGTGKTMFCPLISSFERVQNARFEYMFEYLCIASKFNRILPDASESLLNLISDIKLYDGMISREVNFRPSDLSSVFNSSKAYKYLKQLFYQDGSHVELRLKNEKPILFLVTHQLLSCIEPAIKSFGSRLKIIEMVRHPAYLVEHWATYIAMHGKNSRDFTLWFNYKNKTIPWFAKGIEEKYINSNDYDKVIYCINELMKPVFKYHSNNDYDDNLFYVPFEKFVLDPSELLNNLECFLKTSKSSSTKKFLKKQKVPRDRVTAGPQKKIYQRYGLKKDKNISDKDHYDETLNNLKTKCSKPAYELLLRISKEYERNFGLWF